MPTTPAITIGFPVYNVEKYVQKSLESAINQDFENFEIIVIDDCGKDNSIEVIKALITSHPKGDKVRIIKHEQNKGLAEARNTVIKNAKGKYIYFMDSDDYIFPQALSLLYKTAEQYQADCVFSSNIKQEGERTWTDSDDVLPERHFLKDGEFVTYVYMTPHALVPITAWNIMFKTCFIHDNGLFYPNIRYQEDIAFNELFHPLVKRAVFLSEQTYCYVIRRDSLMNKTYRPTINIEEAYRAFHLCEIIKDSCQKWKNESFYCGKCAVVMRNCFYDMGGLLKHKKQFTNPLPLNQVRDAMRHPASLIEILHFKQFKKDNLFYYIMGVLPTFLSISLMDYVCKKKGFYKN
jgi:glycosyltransferase involved in cell wall biosynthesis